MMRPNPFHVFLLALSVLGAEGYGEMPNAISIAGADQIFPIVPSSSNHDVAAFAVAPIDGEITYGTPIVVTQSGKGRHLLKLTKRTIDTEGLLWSSAANKLYASTPRGIYVWHLGRRAEILRRGETAGLALSSDDRLLAFWDFSQESSNNDFELVVFDVNSRTELRRWKVETRYDKDKHGFDLLFGKDGTVLYARTFDSADVRPLKAFEIATGRSATLSTNSLCMAETADGVFYVQAQGRYATLERPALFRIRDWNQGEPIRAGIPAVVCSGNRDGHLLVTVEKGKVWSYNTSRKQFNSFPTACDRAAVFSDGSFVFARKNRLSWGECE